MWATRHAHTSESVPGRTCARPPPAIPPHAVPTHLRACSVDRAIMFKPRGDCEPTDVAGWADDTADSVGDIRLRTCADGLRDGEGIDPTSMGPVGAASGHLPRRHHSDDT